MGLRCQLPTRPMPYASYPVLVHRLGLSLLADLQCCQRMQPTLKRRISSARNPANNQTAAVAWTMVSGYQGACLLRFRPNGFCGRSCVLRLRPAFISLAHRSASITRGSGPTSLAIAGGVARVRFGSNFRGISSHSCRSLKNARTLLMRLCLALGVRAFPKLTFSLDLRIDILTNGQAVKAGYPLDG